MSPFSSGVSNNNNWYGDSSYFINHTSPWFYTGGYFGSGVTAGQFNFNKTDGNDRESNGSRLVLVG